MPIYEFTCQSCGHDFEKIVSFSAATTPACPACASADVGRHMSRPAIHFKGSGWYITDSRKGNGKQSNNGTSANGHGESSKAEGSAEGSTESAGKAEGTDSAAGDSKAAAKSGDSAKAGSSAKTASEA